MNGILIALISAILIGISTPPGVEVTKQIGFLQIASYSSLLSSVFLLILVYKSKIKINISEIKKYRKKIAEVVLSRGVLGTIFLFLGWELTNAIHTVFILRLEPIFVALWAYFLLKDKINIKQAFLILSIVLGAFIFSTNLSFSEITNLQIGDLLIILSLLLFSYSYFPAKEVMEKIDPLVLTVINNGIGGIILFVIMLIFGFNFLTISGANMTLFLMYVFTFGVFGIYFYFYSLKLVKPWIVSSLLSLSSIVGALLAYFWFGETLTIIQMFGASIILLASLMISLEGRDNL